MTKAKPVLAGQKAVRKKKSSLDPADMRCLCICNLFRLMVAVLGSRGNATRNLGSTVTGISMYK